MIKYYTYGFYYNFKPTDKQEFATELIAKTKRFSTNYSFVSNYTSNYYRQLQRVWGLRSPFIRTLIVRGIGYRLLLIENKEEVSKETLSDANKFLANKLTVYSQDIIKSYGDTVIPKSPYTNRPYTKYKSFHDNYYESRGEDSFLDDYRAFHDLQFSRFLIVRVGHTTDTIVPLSKFIDIKPHKKERKITIYGYDKVEVRNLAKTIYKMRKPSPYTGRGIKFKHVRVRYKKVRKTKAGGRAF